VHVVKKNKLGSLKFWYIFRKILDIITELSSCVVIIIITIFLLGMYYRCCYFTVCNIEVVSSLVESLIFYLKKCRAGEGEQIKLFIIMTKRRD